jgi:hypothetical protein
MDFPEAIIFRRASAVNGFFGSVLLAMLAISAQSFRPLRTAA